MYQAVKSVHRHPKVPKYAVERDSHQAVMILQFNGHLQKFLTQKLFRLFLKNSGWLLNSNILVVIIHLALLHMNHDCY